MNRILIASALALGLTGAAMAQEAPQYVGDYDANASRQLNDDISGNNEASASYSSETVQYDNVDRTTTSSVSTGEREIPTNINLSQKYSGR